MSGEERAMWIDRAIDENEEEIKASSGLAEAVGIVTAYCETRAGFADITGEEYAARLVRKMVHKLAEMTVRAAEMAGRDPESVTVADAAEILEARGEDAPELARLARVIRKEKVSG